MCNAPVVSRAVPRTGACAQRAPPRVDPVHIRTRALRTRPIGAFNRSHSLVTVPVAWLGLVVRFTLPALVVPRARRSLRTADSSILQSLRRVCVCARACARPAARHPTPRQIRSASSVHRLEQTRRHRPCASKPRGLPNRRSRREKVMRRMPPKTHVTYDGR